MISVIGAGSWGSALASVLLANNYCVCIYGRELAVLNDIKDNRRNAKYLGDLELYSAANSSLVTVSNNLAATITDKTEYIVVCIPSGAFVQVVYNIKAILVAKKLKNIPIILATKGLCESRDGQSQWLHQAIHQELGKDYPYCILSGPSFAKEVAAKQPTSIVMASDCLNLAATASKIFHNKWFRVYLGDDVLGAELGGAMKNILAFVAGCSEGNGFGCNARASLITRGLHEMLGLGKVLAVKPETLMGLTGLGDLVLTATDNQSRNKRFGLYIGQGLSIAEATKKVGQHVASFETTKLVYKLVKKYKLDMPLTEQSYKVLYEGISIEQAIANLAERPQKIE